MDGIDLYSLSFWSIAATAPCLLVPLTRADVRKLLLASLNLAFLALFLGPWLTLTWVLGAIAAVWLVLRLTAAPSSRLGTVALVIGGLAVLALFILHKRPLDLDASPLARLQPVLGTIGFSYVALRLVEVARAVRDGRHAPPDLVALVNYLLPFHMLAAGPIQSYDDFVAQPAVPAPLGIAGSLGAIERIVAGLFKKYVLAHFIKTVFLTDYRATGGYVFLEMQLTYIWLYLDFSAYSDVAVGVGALMGVATPENFNRPYVARNLIDYWERWHISLSQFIRRNIFIPAQMALMRRTDGRHALAAAGCAFTLSFLLCGLWHEISLRWLVWGAFHAAGLTVCNLYRHFLTKRLGRKGTGQYLANPWVRASAIVLTFEYAATALWIATGARF
jgi:D-alanyl-lipoteichoic acid acyltransferase DltB (MBOAT superfamily)